LVSLYTFSHLQASLLLGWVTVYGQVYHLGIIIISIQVVQEVHDKHKFKKN